MKLYSVFDPFCGEAVFFGKKRNAMQFASKCADAGTTVTVDRIDIGEPSKDTILRCLNRHEFVLSRETIHTFAGVGKSVPIADIRDHL